MSQQVSPGDMIKNIQTDAQGLIKDNVALAQAELKPAAKHAGIGGGMFGAAGYVGVNALSLLFLAMAFALSMIFTKGVGWSILPSLALGFVCAAVVLLLIAGILALLGKGQISKVQPPKATIAEAKASVDAIKTSIKRGQDAVKANSLARKEIKDVKTEAKHLDTV